MANWLAIASLPGDENRTVVQVQKIHKNKEVEIVDGAVKIRVNLVITGRVGEVTGSVDLANPTTIDMLEQATAQTIKAEVEHIITISVQTVLGLELVVKANFPYYLFTQTIHVFDVIERIESINAVVWFFGVFLKCFLFLYLAATGMAQVFGVKSYKAFIIPIALLELVIALKSPIIRFDVMSRIFSYTVVPFTTLSGMFVIPLLVMIVYFFRRKSLSL